MNLARQKTTIMLVALSLMLLGCRRAEANLPKPDPPLQGSPSAPGAGSRPLVITLTPLPADSPRATDAAPLTPSPTATPPRPTPSPTPNIQSWREAFTLQRNGEYDQAIWGYRALLDRQPSPRDTCTIRFHLGETYLLKGEPAAAADVLSTHVVSCPEDASAWFLLGRAWEALEDWAGALEAFQAYRRLDDTLADHAGLRIAQALEKLGRTDEAMQEYETVAQITPDNTLAVSALEHLAEIALMQDNPGAAAKRYAQAAERATKRSEQARLLGLAGASYLAGDRVTEAVRLLQRVVREYTATRSAYMALDELRLLEQPVNLRTQGLVYYYNQDYRSAVDALTRYLDNEPAPFGDALYFLGRSYEGLGRWQSAIDAYDRLIDEYPGDERYGAAWVRKARALRRLGDAEEAVATYREFARMHPNDPLTDNALWEAARTLEALDQDADAAELYRLIVERYPYGDVGAEASFRAGILPYLNNDYATAREAWQQAAQRARTAEVRARALLWAGKAALALGDTDTAIEDFATVARVAPLNFDGLRAQELLTELAPGEVGLPSAAPPSLSVWLRMSESQLAEIDRQLENDPHYQRGRKLLTVGLRDAGLAELKALRDAHWNLPAHLARLAMLLDDPSTRHLSIASAERALTLTGTSPLDAPTRIARLAYPVEYRTLILRESKRYGIDPRLLAALIRQESRFNPTATSYAHARGLTQVIPSTGWFIAGKLDVMDFEVESLYRPSRSIRFGAWYLAQQMEAFGDPILALAAYNGGPGNSRRWQQLTDDVDMLVASIHLDQTRQYVRQVMEQYAIYQVLYNEELSLRGNKTTTE